MATVTLGTALTTSLTALPFNPMAAPADMATIMNLIKKQGSGNQLPNDYAAQGGLLFFPGRRGFVCLEQGDYVGIDSNGWPIFVSKQSIARVGSSWVHS